MASGRNQMTERCARNNRLHGCDQRRLKRSRETSEQHRSGRELHVARFAIGHITIEQVAHDLLTVVEECALSLHDGAAASHQARELLEAVADAISGKIRDPAVEDQKQLSALIAEMRMRQHTALRC